MKKLVLFLTIMFITMSYSQETKQIPLINVNGEGKVKVAPDRVCISATVETKGNNAKEVKKQNDENIDAVLIFIKKMNVPAADFKTCAPEVERAAIPRVLQLAFEFTECRFQVCRR